MLAGEQTNVAPMPLLELVGQGAQRYADTLISGMQLDSRAVKPGDVFLAMPGDVHDGRQFIEQAVANGASAVLAEAPVAGFVDDIHVPLIEIPELRLDAGVLAARFYRYPSRDMRMVGVTGTNGKTTTTRLIAQLARGLGKSCGVIGTLGAALDDSVTDAVNTTPNAVTLQQQLAQWSAKGVFAVAMEVSSHALVQGRVNGVEFETAVFTNLSHDHLDYHGSMAAYGRAKLGLFDRDGLRHALVNVDDAFAGTVRNAVGQHVNLLTYSAMGAPADLRVEGAAFNEAGVRGELITPWGREQLVSPLPGAFNLANVTAAIAALVLAGEDLAKVVAAAASLQPVPGRMQTVANHSGLQVIIDYAHTADALEQVLLALRPHVSGNLITVFGCGGDRDRAKRQVMGRVASACSDQVVVTSDNPRNEDPRVILSDIESGCSGNYRLLEDRAEAIAAAVGDAKAGDCVVIAGKGHENYQLVQGDKLAFSDEAHARAAISRREQL
jgi:UDP-N-acetylmuramoyl-L-alanyl-D-glutamate--2,6-diaminopimelate ligase